MGFYQLLLGHLLGDFAFQTNRIAEKKALYWKWNLLHAAIVTLNMLIFTVSSGITAIFLVLAAGVLHYFIDLYKPWFSEKCKTPELVNFILDQSIHIVIIYIISLLVDIKPAFSFLDLKLTKVLITIVVVSYFAAILDQYILSMIFPGTRELFFENGEKGIGIITRLLMTFGLYFSCHFSILLLAVIPAALYMLYRQYKKSWCKWMSFSQLKMKSILDILVSLTGLAILIF